MYRSAKSASRALTAGLLAGAMLIAVPAANAAQLGQTSATPRTEAAAPSSASGAGTPSASAPARVQPGRVEARINEMKKRLMITPAQEDKWNAFAQVMRDNADHERQLIEQRDQSLRSMTAVDDIKSYAQITQVHAEGVQKLTQAFEDLYGSMTPQQQKNADHVFATFAERRAARERHHASRATGNAQRTQ